jgi:hypothetical protein
MESLTSFLLSEQELSLDAFTDSMLANLPQQADGICNLDPIVPFQTLPGKEPGTHKMHGPSVVKTLSGAWSSATAHPARDAPGNTVQ